MTTIRLGAYCSNKEAYKGNLIEKGSRVDFEIVEESFKLQGYGVQMELVGDKLTLYERLEKGVFEGAIDVVTRRNTIAALDDACIFYNRKIILISLLDNTVSSIEELSGKAYKVGCVNNCYYYLFQDHSLKDILFKYDSYDDLIDSMKNDEVQFMLIDDRTREYLINTNRLFSKDLLTTIEFEIFSSIYFSDSNKEIRDIFENGIKMLIDTNQYFEIVRKLEKMNDITYGVEL